METITKEKFINVFRDKSICLFTWEDIFKIFDLRASTVKALLGRLRKGKIIQLLSRKKYLFLLGKRLPEDFEIANYIYAPSYVSLESALSFYGLIDQFPYQVTSITLRKTRNFEINGKSFAYHHIRPAFFLDYRKKDNYLIAGREKAVFDLLYLVYKGARAKTSLKLLRLDKEKINKKLLEINIKKLAGEKDKKFISFCQNQDII